MKYLFDHPHAGDLDEPTRRHARALVAHMETRASKTAGVEQPQPLSETELRAVKINVAAALGPYVVDPDWEICRQRHPLMPPLFAGIEPSILRDVFTPDTLLESALDAVKVGRRDRVFAYTRNQAAFAQLHDHFCAAAARHADRLSLREMRLVLQLGRAFAGGEAHQGHLVDYLDPGISLHRLYTNGLTVGLAYFSAKVDGRATEKIIRQLRRRVQIKAACAADLSVEFKIHVDGDEWEPVLKRDASAKREAALVARQAELFGLLCRPGQPDAWYAHAAQFAYNELTTNCASHGGAHVSKMFLDVFSRKANMQMPAGMRSAPLWELAHLCDREFFVSHVSRYLAGQLPPLEGGIDPVRHAAKDLLNALAAGPRVHFSEVAAASALPRATATPGPANAAPPPASPQI